MRPFAEDLGYKGYPFIWNEETRAQLRAELDAAFFHLYLPANADGTWQKSASETEEEYRQLASAFPAPRDAVEYIMDSFPFTRRKDEEKHGYFRPKALILQQCDELGQGRASWS